jgi:integrase
MQSQRAPAHYPGDWIQNNPCVGVKLPQRTGHIKVMRTILSPEQVNVLAARLEEPYATLVLFLAARGLRIGEAIAIKSSDFDGNMLNVVRRVYEGEVGPLKTRSSFRKLPLNPELVKRLRSLGSREWIFCSKAGTPLNPGNAWNGMYSLLPSSLD